MKGRSVNSIIATKKYVIENKNNDLLGATLVNLGGTDLIFDEKLPIPGTQKIATLFTEAETPYFTQDTKIEFANPNDTNNKIYISINRRVERKEQTICR